MKIVIGTLKHSTEEKPVFTPDEPLYNDVYEVCITEHPNASRGIPKRVGFCGIRGNMAPLSPTQHMLQDAEIPIVCKAVGEWQKAMQAKAVANG